MKVPATKCNTKHNVFPKKVIPLKFTKKKNHKKLNFKLNLLCVKVFVVYAQIIDIRFPLLNTHTNKHFSQ